MQEFVAKQQSDNGLNILSFNDKQNLVGAFAWLIQEDKKQNPELYKLNKQNND